MAVSCWLTRSLHYIAFIQEPVLKSFHLRISPSVEREIAAAILAENSGAENSGDAATAFMHLERAHILGQASTRHHVRVHLLMFCWGWRRKQWKECLGQLLRLAGAATKTAFGLVPTGNPGGTRISPFRSVPVPPDLQQLITAARPATSPSRLKNRAGA